MGPGASSSTRGPSPPLAFLPLLFLFLLTRGVSPVSGNEGGTAGSCPCVKRTNINADVLIKRVKSRDNCQESSLQYDRFIFPTFNLCTLLGDPGGEGLKELMSQKANATADASKGGQGPPAGTPTAQPDPRSQADAPPTSKGPPTARPDPLFPTDAPRTTGTKQEEEGEETPATRTMPSEPPLPPGAAVGQPTPQQGGGSGQLAPRSSSSSHTTIAIVSLLGLVLVLVAVVMFLICRRRRRNGPLHPAVLGEETHRLNLPEKT